MFSEEISIFIRSLPELVIYLDVCLLMAQSDRLDSGAWYIRFHCVNWYCLFFCIVKGWITWAESEWDSWFLFRGWIRMMVAFVACYILKVVFYYSRSALLLSDGLNKEPNVDYIFIFYTLKCNAVQRTLLLFWFMYLCYILHMLNGVYSVVTMSGQIKTCRRTVYPYTIYVYYYLKL